MIRMLQNGLQKGRCLEVTDLQAENVGIANFIMVDRENLLNTGFDELRSIKDPFITLEVQFYGEVWQYFYALFCAPYLIITYNCYDFHIYIHVYTHKKLNVGEKSRK